MVTIPDALNKVSTFDYASSRDSTASSVAANERGTEEKPQVQERFKIISQIIHVVPIHNYEHVNEPPCPCPTRLLSLAIA